MDEDAVQLVTWHRSKGREWPVVVVAGTDCPVKPRLPHFSVAYENFDDLGAVLESALIEVSPDFAAVFSPLSFPFTAVDLLNHSPYRKNGANLAGLLELWIDPPLQVGSIHSR